MEKQTAYERAEQTSKEIIQFCIDKGMQLDEFEALMDALPIAIKQYMKFVKSKTRLE